MAEKRKFEFFVLRYVPDAVKGEFVNVGLLLFEVGASGPGFADVRFTKDWGRVRCLDPGADIGLLTALENDLRRSLVESVDRQSFVRRIEDSFSNLIQVSGTKGCFSDNPAEELRILTRLYLKKRVLSEPVELDLDSVDNRPRGSGRNYIMGEIRHAFEQVGVWKLLMHGIPVTSYSHQKDPFKFDFGYRVDDQIKLFQAVSLTSSVDLAVLLAAKYQKIASRILEIESRKPLLTAVVEDGVDRSRPEVEYALEMMEESRIRVATTGEMRGIAELARRELGA